MAVSVQTKLIITFLVCSNICISITECKNKTKTEKSSEKIDEKKVKPESLPVSVDSRFSGLGGLANKLFPNFNQGQQGNPVTNFPQNAQNYLRPGENQGNYYQTPNQGNFQPYPNQGPQTQGFNPQGPYNNGPNQWQAQYPDQGYNGPNNYQFQPSNQYPMNNQNGMVNQGNWRPNFNGQDQNQYLNEGRPIQSPISNGMHTHVQVPPNMGNWNQQRPIPDPDSGRPFDYPNQGSQRPPFNNEMNNPNVNNLYPGNNNYPSRPDFNQQNPVQFPNQGQNPNQSGFQNLNNGNQNGGTLDDFVPQYNNGSQNMNAILGKPVKVPSSTFSPDQIVFEDSSESPLQTQCVQDCPSTSEYSPVCGTNNVTYFNPGKFVCARNCGIKVYVAKRGVCQRRPM